MEEDLKRNCAFTNRSFLISEIALATDYHKNQYRSPQQAGGCHFRADTLFFPSERDPSKALTAEFKTSVMSGQVCLLKKGHCCEEQTCVRGFKLGGIRLTDTIPPERV